jgi:sulfur-oxidizing protein SoxY
MEQNRRDFLRVMGNSALVTALAGAGFFTPDMALAANMADPRNQLAFDAKTMEDALKALGAATPTKSSDIQLTAPDIAENGSVVPINVASAIPKTDAIAILVDKNPNALTAMMYIPDGTEAYATARVKMQQTSTIAVLVRAEGKFYIASKEVKVTLGGCGG